MSAATVARRLRLGPGGATVPGALGLIVFFLAPVVTLLVYSFLTSGRFSVARPFTLSNYGDTISASGTSDAVQNSVLLGAVAAGVAVVIGLAIASWLRYYAGRLQNIVLSMIIISMFASYLVRIYAFRILLGDEGAVNTVLDLLGLTSEPIPWLLFSRFAVVCALTHIALPYIVLILYGAFRPLDPAYLEAAQDLGAGALTRWFRVILPTMAAPIGSAFLMTFVLTSADYVTPQFLGGTGQQMVGLLIQTNFTVAGDWARGAALSFLTLGAYLLCYVIMGLGLRIARLNKIRWGS